MFKYETHLHTLPSSKCGSANVKEVLTFYKAIGYDGIFITNHFLDGNSAVDRSLSYREQIEFHFADYYEALELSGEIGIKVFCGTEMSYKGTDFLVYGLDKDWFLSHPEIMEMKKSEQLSFLRQNGALVIQAHPYREAAYIDHIRLFPRCVDGVEVINANRPTNDNRMADVYADCYGLLKIAGSDNHCGPRQKLLAGIWTEAELCDVNDFISAVKEGKTNIFSMPNPLI